MISRPGCGRTTPRAKVTSEFDLSLNAVAVELNGRGAWRPSAGAPLVQRAEYQDFFYRVSAAETADDPDLRLISAGAAWGGGGAANAGAGVKVAIIDSGVDYTHPCFDDAGYAPQTQIGDRRFTNNKVIAAKVFNMRAGVRRLHAGGDRFARHARGRHGCLQLRHHGKCRWHVHSRHAISGVAAARAAPATTTSSLRTWRMPARKTSSTAMGCRLRRRLRRSRT